MLNILKTFLVVAISFLASGAAQAQTNSCIEMAAMAKDIANLRDMGIPLARVEERLGADVKNSLELKVALTAARLVYKTQGNGNDLKKEILKICR